MPNYEKISLKILNLMFGPIGSRPRHGEIKGKSALEHSRIVETYITTQSFESRAVVIPT